jgi:hypothetical protein
MSAGGEGLDGLDVRPRNGAIVRRGTREVDDPARGLGPDR